jgi:hypothetical protein
MLTDLSKIKNSGIVLSLGYEAKKIATRPELTYAKKWY